MADILVIGGGFAGMWAALTAAREFHEQGTSQSVALISREPYLTIRPRLYEASPQDMRAPLHPVLDVAGVAFLQGDVTQIDPVRRTVEIHSAANEASIEVSTMTYNRLVVATGSVAHIPKVPGFGDHTFSIDDFASAVTFDSHLAKVCGQLKHPPAAPGAGTFAIIGAGFSGIELACEMRQRIAVHAGGGIADAARIVLLEKSDAAGPELGPGPRPQIEAALNEARIDLHTGVDISEVTDSKIRLTGKSDIETCTAVLTTGQIAAVPPGLESIARDGAGRLQTNDALRVNGLDGVFAAGDSAEARADDDHMALMSCQHAMPMGKHAGYNAARDILGLELRPYRQPNYVTCLDLGRSGAVFTTGWERIVSKTGQEAGALKRTVNTQWIYPPTGTFDDIMAAAHIDKRAGR